MATNYRGVNIPSFIVVKKINFMTLPKLDLVTQRVPNRAGIYYSKTNLGEKVISLDIIIKPTTGISTIVQAEILTTWLRGTSLAGFDSGALILDDNSTKYYNAIPSNSVDVSDLISVGEGKIDFLLADPYAYTNTETNISKTGTTGLAITYNGTAPYYPLMIFTLTASTTNPRIDDTVTGESVKLVGTFASGTIIEIDNAGRKVKVNGALAMDKLDITSEWLSLSKYKSSNTFNAVASTSGVTFKYREAYQ